MNLWISHLDVMMPWICSTTFQTMKNINWMNSHRKFTTNIMQIEKEKIEHFMRNIDETIEWCSSMGLVLFSSNVFIQKECSPKNWIYVGITSFMENATNIWIECEKMCVVDVLLTNLFEILLQAKVLLYSNEKCKYKRQWKGNSIHRSETA